MVIQISKRGTEHWLSATFAHLGRSSDEPLGAGALPPRNVAIGGSPSRTLSPVVQFAYGLTAVNVAVWKRCHGRAALVAIREGGNMTTERMLKGHDLFQSLTPEEVHRANQFSSVRRCQAEDVIFRAGDAGSHLFIVLEGSVNLLVPSAATEVSVVIARANQGDLFGLSPLLGSKQYTLSAQCSRATDILAVEVRPLREILLSNSVVGFDVMTSVARTYYTRYIEVTRRLQGIVAQLPLLP